MRVTPAGMLILIGIKSPEDLVAQLGHWRDPPRHVTKDWIYDIGAQLHVAASDDELSVPFQLEAEILKTRLVLPNLVRLVFQTDLEVPPNDTRIAELINLIHNHRDCAVAWIGLHFQTPEGPGGLPLPLPGLAEALLGCHDTLVGCSLGNFCSPESLIPLLEAPDKILHQFLWCHGMAQYPHNEQTYAALAGSPSLKSVNLISIPATHSNLVAQMIQRTPSIEKLQIVLHTGFDILSVFEALKGNTSLKALELNRTLQVPEPSAPGPGLTDIEAEALVAVLEKQFTLTSFAATANPYYRVSLAKWPKIGFYLGLNKGGRGRILATEHTAYNEWIPFLLAGRKNPSHTFYYLQKNPDVLKLCQGQPTPRLRKRSISEVLATSTLDGH